MEKTFIYDEDHAVAYLNKCVFRYKNIPVFILRIRPGLILEAQTLGTGRITLIKLKDNKLDLSPVPLGFSNVIQPRIITAKYMFRLPKRNWKVGLSRSNLSEPPIDFSHDHFLTSHPLRDTIQNVYPNIEYILKLSKKASFLNCAFSRNFALTRDGYITFKMYHHPVGILTEKKEIELYEHFSFMQALLEKDLNHGK